MLKMREPTIIASSSSHLRYLRRCFSAARPPPPSAPNLHRLGFVSSRSIARASQFPCVPIRNLSSNSENISEKERSTLNVPPSAGRAAIDFLGRAKSRPEFRPSDDEVYSYMVECFRRFKCLTSPAIRNITEIAMKFGLSPDDVFRRVKFLKGLEFSESTIARVLETVPAMVIMSSEDKILSNVEFLLGIGIQTRELDRIFGYFPGILVFSVENRLKPLLDEFEALGFSSSDVRREVLREPQVLGLENGELSQCVEMLRKLKCRVAIKESIYREGEFRAGYKVKLRIDCLRKHGLIYRDAFTVLWKEPRVILYGVDDIEKKVNFLVRKMKFDIQCLVEVPEFLGVNFEKQIVPRFSVIEYLRAVNGLGEDVGLRGLLKLSRMRFYNMYVKPYPECERMYSRFAGGGGDVVVRSRHPTGMWKLFRPHQYPQSGNDVKNIKAFVESLP